jgi:Transposase DDE domain group 1
VQHSALETQHNLERVVPMAQRLSAAGPKAPILVRKDSGFDSAELMRAIESHNRRGMPQVDFLIKWNPRKTDVAELTEQRDADPHARWEHPRKGKRVCLWEQTLHIEGIDRPVRRVLRLIERTIDGKGQHLIMAERELEGWTTTLPAKQFSATDIIALYADHGTHEQFHSEFKTDLDLQRLPSGKFDTNHLVCELAAVAMNILRLMGQAGLHGPDAPVRHPAKRRRIKTVIQELIYKAGRLIKHGRQRALGLGANDRAAAVFMRLHAQFAATA